MVKLESIHILTPDGEESGILFKPPIVFDNEILAADFRDKLKWTLDSYYAYDTIYTASWEYLPGSSEGSSIQNT